VTRVAADASAPQPSGPSLQDKPSLAVMPFQNMSGDPEQEYFTDGMVEVIPFTSRLQSAPKSESFQGICRGWGAR
jgi:TolB-like protein